MIKACTAIHVIRMSTAVSLRQYTLIKCNALEFMGAGYKLKYLLWYKFAVMLSSGLN